MSGSYRRPCLFTKAICSKNIRLNKSTSFKKAVSTRTLVLKVRASSTRPGFVINSAIKNCIRCLTNNCALHSQHGVHLTTLFELNTLDNSDENINQQKPVSTANHSSISGLSAEKQLQQWEEHQSLLDQKHMGAMDEPLSESELKAMYDEIVSLSREDPAGYPDSKVHLRDIIEKLKPVLFDDQGDIHRTILTKVDHEAERDDVVNQALIVSRELGQKHLSLHIFNLLVYIHSLSGRSKQAALVVNKIQEMGINPDEKTFSFLMNAYANDGDLQKTIEKFKLIQTSGLKPSPNSYGILIKAYAKHKRVDDAFDVYAKMKKLGITPSQPIFGTLIQACIKAGQVDRAWKTFDHMRLKVCQADLVSFTLMLSACAKRGEAERAMNLFEEMGEQGIVPSQHAFNAVISACSSRPDYYATALEILDRMITLHGFQPDIYTLNTLLHAAQTGRRLEDARTFFSKIISIEDGTEQAGVAYTNLFYAYAKHCKPSRKDEGYGVTLVSTSTALVDSDIFTALSRPSPVLAGDCIAEARLVMQHMDTAFSKDTSQQLAWARVSYLLIHTNYCNFDEAMNLYSTYYAQIRPHPNVYLNMLSMCFKLRKAEAIETLWSQVEPLLAPLRPKSTLSYHEKKEHKAASHLSNAFLANLYRKLVNGFARMDNVELGLSLLEDMSRDFDLKFALKLDYFKTLYQKVLDAESQELKAQVLRLCPDPKAKSMVRAKTKLVKKWSPETQDSNCYSEHIRREQEILSASEA